METKKFRSSLFSGPEIWWTQIPLMLSWGVFLSPWSCCVQPSFSGTYGWGFFCTLSYWTITNKLFYLTVQQNEFARDIPPCVNGSCLASPPHPVGPLGDPERPQWDMMEGQMMSHRGPTRQGVPTGRPGSSGCFWDCQKKKKKIGKTYPVQWNNWSRWNLQISQLL